MSLTIALDQPQNTVFRAGNTVSGRVILIIEKDLTGGLVHIDFAGRSDSAVLREVFRRPNSYLQWYYSKGYYFYLTQVLSSETHHWKQGQYSWPFAFPFPSHAVQGLVQSPRGKGDVFEVEPRHHWRGTGNDGKGPHVLPSSFEIDDRNKIKYYLRASFMPQEGSVSFLHKGLDTVTDVNFLRRNPTPPSRTNPALPMTTYTYDCEVRSFAMLGPELHRGESFTDKLKSKFNTASTPCVPLTIVTEFASAVPRDFAGKIIPWRILVKRRPAIQDPKCEYPNNQIHLEEVEICDIEINIHGQTETRAGGKNDYDRSTFELVGQEKSFKVKVDHADLSEAERNGVGPVMKTDMGNWAQVRMPADLVESFATYNIACWYDVTMTVTLKAHEEKISCELMSEAPFEVWPAA